MIEKKKFRAVSLDKLDNETIMKICEWRNQDFVREMMFNKHIISEEEHIDYITKVKNDPNRNIFVFYLDGEPFAVIQSIYFPEKDYVETGDYLIDKKYQLLGYGAIAKFFCFEIMFDILKYSKIHGEVLDVNKKNLSLARKICKKVDKSEVGQTINGVYHEVYIVDNDKESWYSDKRKQLGKVVSNYVEENYEIIMEVEDDRTRKVGTIS